jgi:hypothetical protein
MSESANRMRKNRLQKPTTHALGSGEKSAKMGGIRVTKITTNGGSTPGTGADLKETSARRVAGVSCRLNSVTNARKTYARLVRAYLDGRMDDRCARTVVFMLNGLIASFRLEKDIAIEQRLEDLERQLERMRGKS